MTAASRIARLEREARGLERDGHEWEAHILRTTIHAIRTTLDLAEPPRV